MADALFGLQQAIYNLLSQDATLTGMVQGVFDGVPDQQTFPYAVIGDWTTTPWETHTSLGAESTITIHVWSRHHGNKECLQILGQVYQLLHHKGLAVSGQSLVDCVREFQETFREQDGVTRHGVARYRLTTQEV